MKAQAAADTMNVIGYISILNVILSKRRLKAYFLIIKFLTL